MKFKKLILLIIVVFSMFLVAGCSCDKEKFVVKFDSAGGSSISNQNIKKDGTVTKPVNPTKEEYQFLYWELNGEEYNFSNKVTKNITLVARWEVYSATSYLILFNSDGGSVIQNQSVNENGLITKPASPIKEGYNFLYWELNGEEYNFNNKTTSNITLVAKWEKIEESEINYKVTFNSNGGSKVTSKTVVSGKKAAKPTNPVRTGYTFLGWYLNDNLYDFNTKVTKNITLIAKWEAVIKYQVTFNSNGGSNISSQNIVSGEKITKPTNPAKSGYTFLGWYLNDSLYDFNTKVTKNITLVAKWEKIADVYTIEVEIFEIGTPQRKIIVKKNQVIIKAAAVLSSSNVLLGTYNTKEGVILTDVSEVSAIAKVKLNDGTIVNIKK